MRIYIKTYGCQMNVYDVQSMEGILRASGHEPVDNLDDAEMAVLYTCAVRDGAVQRVYGQLGHLKGLKRTGRLKYVGLAGCMAKHEAEVLLDRCDFVDWILGPSALAAVPEILDRVQSGERPVVVLDLMDVEDRGSYVAAETPVEYPCFVSVMKGCDKACAYCVVPSTRGRERSRAPQAIVEEIQALAERGYAEVTLLGQTVNSYRHGKHDFADLLVRVDAIEGIKRVRFTTSHPCDATDRVFQAMRVLPSVVEHLNLPVQSGSSRVLEAMQRGYTREGYLDTVARFREAIPEGLTSLTTDLIVGFPGETEAEFEETLSLMEAVRFDGCYMFKYSPRRGTPAASMSDIVPDDIAANRLQRVIEVNQRIAAEINRRLVGETLEVMLERRTVDLKSGAEWDARSRTNKVVKISGTASDAAVGDVVQVTVDRTTTYTLFGTRQSRSNR